jgi:hypothetical protein
VRRDLFGFRSAIRPVQDSESSFWRRAGSAITSYSAIPSSSMVKVSASSSWPREATTTSAVRRTETCGQGHRPLRHGLGAADLGRCAGLEIGSDSAIRPSCTSCSTTVPVIVFGLDPTRK